MINLIRWTLLVLFIGMGLICLNTAMFSLWASSGPPTEHPHLYLKNGVRFLGFSFSSVIIGLSAFLVLKKNLKLPKSLILGIAGVLLLFSFSLPYLWEFLEVDKCLDNGGKWNCDELVCEK